MRALPQPFGSPSLEVYAILGTETMRDSLIKPKKDLIFPDFGCEITDNRPLFIGQ
jgi:hypothetical protein